MTSLLFCCSLSNFIYLLLLLLNLPKGRRSGQNTDFSSFILFLFFFLHITMLLLSNYRYVCFIYNNKTSKCNKNEHL